MFTITLQKLEKAWREIYRNKPRTKRTYSRGCDNVSIEMFKRNDLERLKEIDRQVQGGFFKFNTLREYQLKQKGKKKPRLIQAPTVTDRVVQKVMSDYLMDMFLKTFGDAGVVGSVRGNNTKKLLKMSVEFDNKGYQYILKTDIIDFFPSINKKRLKKKFYALIEDQFARNLFDQYLCQSKRNGIPQGTPLSPMMANLYLLNFDQALSQEKKIKHFRYVDDLVVFCRDKRTAERFYKRVDKQFQDIELRIHPLSTEGKTYIERFDSGKVDILGIIYKNGRLMIKPKKYKKFIQECINPIRFKSCLDPRKYSVEEAIEELLNDLKYQIDGWLAAYSFCDIRENLETLDGLLHQNFEHLLSKCALPEITQKKYLVKLPKFTR